MKAAVLAGKLGAELLAVDGGEGTYLFGGRAGGPMNFPRWAWEDALAEAGIEDFRFHDLRHTHASYLAMAGASAAELKESLGHKTLAMVARNTHLSDGHKRQVARRLAGKIEDGWRHEGGTPASD